MRTWAMVVLMLGAGACATTQSTGPTQPAATESTTSENQGPTISPERADAIERLFARKAEELQQCWTNEYEKTHNRKLEGDVTVQMNVAPSGQATDVKVVSSSLGNADVEGCVVKTISGWDFPSGTASVPYSRTVHLGAQY